ncbi:hypothetical protein EYC80_003562 [Monilinia laxa]|uniref:ER lumen protein-retaining receptor n=1 Tax=Monilinia laxa TaxID=61186 RepID=A0A5N6KKB3_MONLA|nr:hypothetical protein EYC80_003562 [Monilinia laxa]
MVGFNFFRILGDISHTLSKCILIYAIHRNSSAEGVSLITQSLYAMVFITRYLDLFSGYFILWNFILKIFYIGSSLYILFLMLRVYARTREREKAWKLGGLCFVGSAVLAPVLMMIFERKFAWGFMEVLWVFSILLESTCVLPQLLLLRQTTVPTVLDSFYLVTLGSYRFFYILNWIWRSLDINDRSPDAISIIGGVIQTAFYIDFAWVYYTRQRVKLRNGGVVDADDISRGWLLNRVLGNKHMAGNEDDEGDEEANPAGSGRREVGRNSSKWGARGISVSADDGVLAGESQRQASFEGQESGVIDGADVDGDAKMKDPDELAKILDDDGDESEEDGTLPIPGESSTHGVSNGSEWRG